MKTQILHLGNNQGYAYLRTLIIICCILLCFSTVMSLLYSVNKAVRKNSEQIDMCITQRNEVEYEVIK